jgi:hypothetical protein
MVSRVTKEPKGSDEMARFAARGRQIQEVLQSVEDALIEAGFEDFAVATEHGTFQWMRAPES